MGIGGSWFKSKKKNSQYSSCRRCCIVRPVGSRFWIPQVLQGKDGGMMRMIAYIVALIEGTFLRQKRTGERHVL